MRQVPKHTLDFIDKWLTLRSEWSDIPGFTVAISQNGKILHSKGYGFADLEKQEAMTADHVFRIASQSKTFTATLVMQLQEQGKLRIDDPVCAHLAWLADHDDERWKTVTIRQLMSHSAGIMRDGIDAEYWNVERDFPLAGELREAILSKRLTVEPNTRLKYSNFGYGLLGMVIEEITGKDYAVAVNDAIIAPLNLSSTTPDLPKDLGVLAIGYSRKDKAGNRYPYPHINTSGLTAATGFSSTAADLSKYFSAHQVGNNTLLTDESKREMQRIQWHIEKENDSAYGLGLRINTLFGRTRVGHGGGFPGYVTTSFVDVNDGICVIVLTNSRAAPSMMINNAIFAIIDEFGYKKPDQDLRKYEGLYSEEYGASYVYANTNGLRIMGYPNSWWPTDTIIQLKSESRGIFKITEDSGTGHFGEEVRFVFDKNYSVKEVMYGGSILRPSVDGDLEPRWIK